MQLDISRKSHDRIENMAKMMDASSEPHADANLASDQNLAAVSELKSERVFEEKANPESFRVENQMNEVLA